jgi:polysaccharide export outer membrane protein
MRTLSTRTLAFASVALWVSLVPKSSTAHAGQVDAGLRPGDVIRVSFWREPELSGEFPVDETGTVVLPLIGSRVVLGISPGDLKAQLQEEYRGRLRNQDAQIVLLQRVRVLGAVRNPGLYHVDRSMTLGDAVALAGGVSPNGTLQGIRIQRDGETVLADLRIETPVAEGMRSGDQILVSQRSWLSRYGTFVVGSALTATAIYVHARRY